MDHNLCRENLSAYLDGELPQGERLALEMHLAGCADCRAELAGLKKVSGLMKAHAMEPVPPALGAVLKEKPGASHPWLKPVLALSTAAAALLVVFNLTKTDENYSLPVGFGSREGGSLPVTEYSSPGPAPAADEGLPAGESAQPQAPAAAEAKAGASAEARYYGGDKKEATAQARAVASVRGSYAQAKFSAPAGTGSGFAAAKAGAKSSAEFSGRVCVYVSSDKSRLETAGDMGDEERDDYFWYLGKAMLFTESTGIPSPSVEPGSLVFLKKDGSRAILTEKDCSLCFVLFDGVKDPLVVTDFIFFADRYNEYFGTSFPPISD